MIQAIRRRTCHRTLMEVTMTVVPFSTKQPTANPPPPDEPRDLCGRLLDMEDKIRAAAQLATALSELLETIPEGVDERRGNAYERLAMKVEEAVWDVEAEWEEIVNLAREARGNG
jgi:hypothetical protein